MYGLSTKQIEGLMNEGSMLTPVMNRLYQSKPERWWLNMTVESVRPIHTGAYEIPAGTKFKVRKKRAGFGLLSEPCPHCGIKVRVYKVPPGSVRLIIPDEIREAASNG